MDLRTSKIHKAKKLNEMKRKEKKRKEKKQNPKKKKKKKCEHLLPSVPVEILHPDLQMPSANESQSGGGKDLRGKEVIVGIKRRKNLAFCGDFRIIIFWGEWLRFLTHWIDLSSREESKERSKKKQTCFPKISWLSFLLEDPGRRIELQRKGLIDWAVSFFFPSWFSNYPSCELRFTTAILISLPSFLPSFLPLMQYFSPASTFIDWNVELESQGRDRKDGKETPSAFQSFHWKVCHWHQSKRARTDGNPISIQSNPSRLSNLLFFF